MVDNKILSLYLIRAYLSKLYLLDNELRGKDLNNLLEASYYNEEIRILNILWQDNYREIIKEFDYAAIDICIYYLATNKFNSINSILDYLCTIKNRNEFKNIVDKALAYMKRLLLNDNSLLEEVKNKLALDNINSSIEKLNIPLFKVLIYYLELPSYELSKAIRFYDSDDDEYEILYKRLIEG